MNPQQDFMRKYFINAPAILMAEVRKVKM